MESESESGRRSFGCVCDDGERGDDGLDSESNDVEEETDEEDEGDARTD